MTWDMVALTYFAYLAAVAAAGHARARRLAILFSLTMIALLMPLALSGGSERWLFRPAAAVLPAAVLLAGYWASGLFFSSPMRGLEQRLLEWDRRLLWDTGILGAYQGLPPAFHTYFEASYLLTYAMAPVGGLVLAVASPDAPLNRFWIAVLGAGLGSYAVLPWVQTRPPRVLEPGDGRTTRGPDTPVGLARRLNLGVLGRASIGANTIPSGHAAVALATALAVRESLPLAGAALLVLALSISVATVAGRYHYAIDTVLGVAAALVAWAVALRVG